MGSLEVSPKASALVMSMRSIGYSFNNAIADIIDNSITAGADEIDVVCDWDEDEPSLEIRDNGEGMDHDELVEAMRPGSKSPVEERAKDDLGRFGLGLKTASFSQCKKLIVKTRKNNTTYIAQWDLDRVVKENKWLLDISELEVDKELKAPGTIIKWECIDTLDKKNKDYSQNYLNELVTKLDQHIGLVFHRYINGEFGKKVTFIVNGLKCTSADPFFKEKSTLLPLEIIKQGKSICKLQAYTLPHYSKCTEQEWRDHEGEEGYIANQGFYLYRNGRLITKATWFGLIKKLDITKLCRVCIDIDNTADLKWQIDVKKSSAIPPTLVRRKLKKIINQLTKPSERRFSHRAKKLTNVDRAPVWERVSKDKEIRYKLNRKHPIIEILSEKLNETNAIELDRIFSLVDSTLPISSIYSDYSQDPKNLCTYSLSLDELVSQANNMIQHLCENLNISKNQAMMIVQSSDPFKPFWIEIEKEL